MRASDAIDRFNIQLIELQESLKESVKTYTFLLERTREVMNAISYVQQVIEKDGNRELYADEVNRLNLDK